METALAEAATNVLEAIKPYEPDDGHKGTFLVLRIAGVEQGTALKIIKRKYRSWQNWRSTDEDFYRVDEAVSALSQRFGGEARVMRTALLDSSIIEAGILIFRKVLRREPVTGDMWTYITRLAGIRMPIIGAPQSDGSPWERLANTIKNTMTQRELTVKEVDVYGVEKSITAKEIAVQPSPEQRQMASDIVGQMLSKAGVEN